MMSSNPMLEEQCRLINTKLRTVFMLNGYVKPIDILDAIYMVCGKRQAPDDFTWTYDTKDGCPVVYYWVRSIRRYSNED